jgi:hypothetical protein
MTLKKKTFDAVEMSHGLCEATSRLLDSMNWEQRKETLRQARARLAARKNRNGIQQVHTIARS